MVCVVLRFFFFCYFVECLFFGDVYVVCDGWLFVVVVDDEIVVFGFVVDGFIDGCG